MLIADNVINQALGEDFPRLAKPGDFCGVRYPAGSPSRGPHLLSGQLPGLNHLTVDKRGTLLVIDASDPEGQPSPGTEQHGKPFALSMADSRGG